MAPPPAPEPELRPRLRPRRSWPHRLRLPIPSRHRLRLPIRSRRRLSPACAGDLPGRASVSTVIVLLPPSETKHAAVTDRLCE